MRMDRARRTRASSGRRPGCWLAAVAIGALSIADVRTLAQQAAERAAYILPPPSVAELFDRDKSYATIEGVSPDGTHVVVPRSTELSTLERMSRETYRLAMLELRPAVNRVWHLDTDGIDRLQIHSIDTGVVHDVRLPGDTFVSDMMWSPDGRHLAFLAHRPERTEVWISDLAGAAERFADIAVMATLGTRRESGRPSTSSSRVLQWTSSGNLITVIVPPDRGVEPTRGPVADGPIIRTTRDTAAPTRTLPFLLQDAHDMDRFRYHTSGQIAELARGEAPQPIGESGMFLSLSLGPDGRHLLTERIVEPLSTIVGYSSFPRRLEVLDLRGGSVSTIREVPLNEDAGRRAAQLEADLPRDVAWRPDGEGLGLVWREPPPSGGEDPDSADDARDDDAEATPAHDRIMRLAAPFDPASAETLARTDSPGEEFRDVRYAHDAAYAFATVRSNGENGSAATQRLVAYDLNRSARRQILVDDFDPDAPLTLPGTILTRATENGIAYALVSESGDAVYLEGPGYRADHRPRPFIDRVPIQTGAAARVFESSVEMFERPVAALDANLERLLVSRESKTVFPDGYLWTRGGGVAKLTNNRDPFPEITGARRVDFDFTRRDGVVVRARISLPVGYREGSRVPAIFWTYPREYSSVEEYRSAALRSRNENAFSHLSYLRWSDIWLTQGYALVYPDVPIIRKGRTYNDNYVQHLVDSLYGAIRAVDQMGYVDIDRIGHGGHSYGAFATANLLAHSPFFKAGIAGDGAYNRSLTPMGFQSERRHIWEAPNVYLEMSPFFNADHIDTPLLMYHGQDDNNSGTFPIQSERLMQVLTGLGKTAALYVYPYESHAPRAKESYLDLWARWLNWFDRYVKRAPDVEPSPF